jgi:hypothetical protein
LAERQGSPSKAVLHKTAAGFASIIVQRLEVKEGILKLKG